jgi:signal transduction histidine kinase
MLECARPRPPKYLSHDIQKIIEHVIDLLKTKVESKQINLELELLDEETAIFCDKDQLIQVFLNLVMNATQHVQKKGIIIIRIIMTQNFVNITVCDNGSGIPDTQKQSVFDPFYTQRKEGVGLGLTVVQQIILAHHGKIFVTDSSYGGACFHIHLPIKNQK